MASLSKTDLVRAVNASGMSTAEKKAVNSIVDSVPSGMWGNAIQAALTAADGGTVDATYGTAEAGVISNNVTRIGEIETALQALGLIA